MKKNLLFKFFIFAVIGLSVAVTSCKDYDDDIKRVDGEIAALKADVPKQLAAIKTELTSAVDAKVAAATAEITTLKGKVANLEANGATKAELNAAKTELMSKVVALDVYNAFKTSVETKLAELKTGLDKAATKEELDAYKLVVTSKFTEVKAVTDALDLRIATLDGALTALTNKQAKDVTMLTQKIADLKAELEPRIVTLETILKVKDGKSEVLADIYAKIADNASEILAVKNDLAAKYSELVAADKELQRQITENKEDIDAIKGRLTKIEGDITALKGRMDKAETAIGLNIENILMLSRQLKGLTFIPTRGLPSEKTMKLYYFAGDYTANHVLMYRVNPSNAKLGRDFTIESLNYQVTTRSASDGVKDGSEFVSVQINGEVTQTGDIIYVPVHIEGPEACDVYGNLTWWGNRYFHGRNVLSTNNFLTHVVNTAEGGEVVFDAAAGENGLSLVITALTNSVEEKTKKEKVYVKSSEMVNTELIPTQIKLAESRKGDGNDVAKSEEILGERLLKTTLAEATAWANEEESNLPNDDKNWNVLEWSGNQGQGGKWTPGGFDLYKYVSSFYYPQDGGDMSHKAIVVGDPHRYLYSEFGKSFGEPYTDKPNYAKPVYKFEQMVYRDTNHNIVIGPEGTTGVTHSYASIDGSMLTVFNNPESIQGIRNKKLIIKVTQVNSECEERQPVGYLVIKFSDDPLGQWPDVEETIDLTPFPYYHKACGKIEPVGKIITKTYSDGGAGTTFSQKNALLELFTADKFMNPINAAESYGLKGVINPGDVNVILKDNKQLNGIGEYNMGNIYNIQRRDASVFGKPKFTAAKYNHVNDDTAMNPDLAVTPEDAFRHVMIRYEYDNHSYIVYVDDTAPAGDYEITYKLENKENNTQHGNVLFLTFKFKVEFRNVTVKRDLNKVNWIDDNTIRVEYLRENNTLAVDGTPAPLPFLSDYGYRVDLREAFVLNTDGTLNFATETKPEINGVKPGDAPHYNLKFEFIVDQDILSAGFTYERDDDRYMTLILLDGTDEIAAQINNDVADKFNRLNIMNNEAGDKLYNYLTANRKDNGPALHNSWALWKNDITLRTTDNWEKLLPVRMVTDINGKGHCDNKNKFANGNYYYVHDFNVKFERALYWAFTTVVLKDAQDLQTEPFDFNTKTNDTYRGLFRHPDANQGYGVLVQHGKPLGDWYGLVEAPALFIETAATHVPDADPASPKYAGLDYKGVEISTDGGKTWSPINDDYKNPTHTDRFFDIRVGPGPGLWEVMWQGNNTGLQSDLYFRVPVINKTAVDNGFAPVMKPGAPAPTPSNEYWMTYRNGYAKVKGYAVFKINKR